MLVQQSEQLQQMHQERSVTERLVENFQSNVAGLEARVSSAGAMGQGLGQTLSWPVPEQQSSSSIGGLG